MWHSPAATAIKNVSALSDCSIILYVMTERWPNIKRYRDAFEAIKRRVMDLMANDKHHPRKVIPVAMSEVWTGLQITDFDMIGGDDLEQMFGDMTSERIDFPQWNDVSMEMYNPLHLEAERIDPQLAITNGDDGNSNGSWDENAPMNSISGETRF
jgi:hypothetical protein